MDWCTEGGQSPVLCFFRAFGLDKRIVAVGVVELEPTLQRLRVLSPLLHPEHAANPPPRGGRGGAPLEALRQRLRDRLFQRHRSTFGPSHVERLRIELLAGIRQVTLVEGAPGR